MNEEFMRRAIELALKNVKDNKGGPFGCVIVKDNKIISEGVNLVTTSNDPTAHAEVLAIRQACQTLNNFILTGCELYTTSEPCPMCLSAIYWAHIDKIFFAGSHHDASKAGFDDSHIYHELSQDISERKIPMHQLMQKEAQNIFQEWIKSDKKVEY